MVTYSSAVFAYQCGLLIGFVVSAFVLGPIVRFVCSLAPAASVIIFAIKAHQSGYFASFPFIQCVLVELEAAECPQAICALICNVFARAVTFLCAARAHEVYVFASTLLDFAVVPRASFEYVFANRAPVAAGR